MSIQSFGNQVAGHFSDPTQFKENTFGVLVLSTMQNQLPAAVVGLGSRQQIELKSTEKRQSRWNLYTGVALVAGLLLLGLARRWAHLPRHKHYWGWPAGAGALCVGGGAWFWLTRPRMADFQDLTAKYQELVQGHISLSKFSKYLDGLHWVQRGDVRPLSVQDALRFSPGQYRLACWQGVEEIRSIERTERELVSRVHSGFHGNKIVSGAQRTRSQENRKAAHVDGRASLHAFHGQHSLRIAHHDSERRRRNGDSSAWGGLWNMTLKANGVVELWKAGWGRSEARGIRSSADNQFQATVGDRPRVRDKMLAKIGDVATEKIEGIEGTFRTAPQLRPAAQPPVNPPPSAPPYDPSSSGNPPASAPSAPPVELYPELAG